MPLIAPFAGLRPAPGRAAELIAPPYDVLDTDEARLLAAGRPGSFLHLSRAELDFPAETDPAAPAVYRRAARHLDRLCAAGLLLRDDAPCLYCYQLVEGDHRQTGLVVAASVAAYRSGRIRRHEVTLLDKEDDRVRQIMALGAQTGPTYLIHRPAPAIDGLLATLTRTAPDAEATIADGTWDGVRHRLWVIREPATIDALVAAFEAQPRLYIADGHHRSAAAARIAAARRGTAECFLAVSFPSDQLRLRAVHRLVRDAAGHAPPALLQRLAAHGTLRPADAPVMPDRHDEFGVYLARQWYRLTLRTTVAAPTDPAAQLAVRRLQDQVLSTEFGIDNPRQDPRLGFVGDQRGSADVVAAVDSGAWSLAFTVAPPALDEVLALADAGALLPPKCTWFTPKLADGMVSLVLNRRRPPADPGHPACVPR